MTHDELLDITGSFTCCSGADEVALLAAVGLHKCSHPRFDLFCDCGNPYSCPTIQAIEKEMEMETQLDQNNIDKVRPRNPVFLGEGRPTDDERKQFIKDISEINKKVFDELAKGAE